MHKRYCWHSNESVMKVLHALPRKIMHMKDRHNIVEFVLHELCDKNCFDISKAAYLVDNPDFNCLKGVAGFCKDECFVSNIWEMPDNFSSHMMSTDFNKKVRGILNDSLTKIESAPQVDKFSKIAHNLGITAYGVCDIKMPHDNHGYFLYEYREKPTDDELECLHNGISLLSFCPLY